MGNEKTRKENWRTAKTLVTKCESNGRKTGGRRQRRYSAALCKIMGKLKFSYGTRKLITQKAKVKNNDLKLSNRPRELFNLSEMDLPSIGGQK